MILSEEWFAEIVGSELLLRMGEQMVSDLLSIIPFTIWVEDLCLTLSDEALVVLNRSHSFEEWKPIEDAVNSAAALFAF